MSDIVLAAEPRNEFGKNANRRLRARQRIPGVVYGHGMENWNVSIDGKEVIKILHSEAGHNTIFKIQMGSHVADVLVRDYQLDPVRGSLLHADFQKVAMDEAMVFEVPVETEGVAEGVRLNGGFMDFVLREIEVECLPGDVPDNLRVDVSKLQIGDAIRVQELTVDSSRITVLSEPDLVVLTIVPPHVEEEEEPGAELLEEEGLEPELIRKGRPEEEGEAAKEAGE